MSRPDDELAALQSGSTITFDQCRMLRDIARQHVAVEQEVGGEWPLSLAATTVVALVDMLETQRAALEAIIDESHTFHEPVQPFGTPIPEAKRLPESVEVLRVLGRIQRRAERALTSPRVQPEEG